MICERNIACAGRLVVLAAFAAVPVAAGQGDSARELIRRAGEAESDAVRLEVLKALGAMGSLDAHESPSTCRRGSRAF
jgi:ABC-type hemin transport system substrate-binding protein